MRTAAQLALHGQMQHDDLDSSVLLYPAWPGHGDEWIPRNHSPPAPPLLPPAGGNFPLSQQYNCYCNWVPANGFDSLGSLLALISLVTALAMLLAGWCNITGPQRAKELHDEEGSDEMPTGSGASSVAGSVAAGADAAEMSQMLDGHSRTVREDRDGAMC